MPSSLYSGGLVHTFTDRLSRLVTIKSRIADPLVGPVVNIVRSGKSAIVSSKLVQLKSPPSIINGSGKSSLAFEIVSWMQSSADLRWFAFNYGGI